MAGPASSNKRQKNSDTGGGPPSGGNFPPQGAPYGQQYPPQGPPYNGPPGQFPMQGGYSSSIPWQSGQQPPYGSQVPYGQQGMYRSSPPLGPGGPMPGGGNWGGGRSGYNGQPPPSSNRSGSQSQGRRGGNQGSSKSPKKAKKSSSGSGNAPAGSGGPYQQGWQQQQQFPMQNQWGPGGPPQMWQGGPGPRPSPPPGAMPGQPMVPVNQNAWSGGGRQSSSPPPRSSKKSRPRSSPDPLMASGGFPQGGMMPSDVLCAPIGLETVPTDLFMTSAGVGTAPDDENTRTKPSGGSSVASREKGRGSYRCGRVSSRVISSIALLGAFVLTLARRFFVCHSVVCRRRAMFVRINQSSNVVPTSRLPKCEMLPFKSRWTRYVVLIVSVRLMFCISGRSLTYSLFCSFPISL